MSRRMSLTSLSSNRSRREKNSLTNLCRNIIWTRLKRSKIVTTQTTNSNISRKERFNNKSISAERKRQRKKIILKTRLVRESSRPLSRRMRRKQSLRKRKARRRKAKRNSMIMSSVTKKKVMSLITAISFSKTKINLKRRRRRRPKPNQTGAKEEAMPRKT